MKRKDLFYPVRSVCCSFSSHPTRRETKHKNSFLTLQLRHHTRPWGIWKSRKKSGGWVELSWVRWGWFMNTRTYALFILLGKSNKYRWERRLFTVWTSRQVKERERDRKKESGRDQERTDLQPNMSLGRTRASCTFSYGMTAPPSSSQPLQPEWVGDPSPTGILNWSDTGHAHRGFKKDSGMGFTLIPSTIIGQPVCLDGLTLNGVRTY